MDRETHPLFFYLIASSQWPFPGAGGLDSKSKTLNSGTACVLLWAAGCVCIGALVTVDSVSFTHTMCCHAEHLFLQRTRQQAFYFPRDLAIFPQQKLLSPRPAGWRLRPRGGQGWLPLRPPSWACRRPSSPCVLTQASLWVCLSPSPLLMRIPVLWDKGHPRDPLFHASLLERPISKCSPLLRSWGSGLQHAFF